MANNDSVKPVTKWMGADGTLHDSKYEAVIHAATVELLDDIGEAFTKAVNDGSLVNERGHGTYYQPDNLRAVLYRWEMFKAQRNPRPTEPEYELVEKKR
jgi:hypothetical protein